MFLSPHQNCWSGDLNTQIWLLPPQDDGTDRFCPLMGITSNCALVFISFSQIILTKLSVKSWNKHVGFFFRHQIMGYYWTMKKLMILAKKNHLGANLVIPWKERMCLVRYQVCISQMEDFLFAIKYSLLDLSILTSVPLPLILSVKNVFC